MIDTLNHKRFYSTQLRPVALATSAGATVFSLVFLGLLIYNGYQHYVLGTQRENRLAERKQQLLGEPENLGLIDEIRQEDLTLRRNKLHYLDTAQEAGIMVLVSAIIAFCSFKWAGQTQGIRPQPKSDDKDPPRVRQRGRARLMVIAVAVLLVAGALYYAKHLPGELAATGPTATDAPSAGPTFASPSDLRRNWHRFRGFAGAGVTSLQDIPTQWNGATGEGIRWKISIPMPGHNSPVVWQDKVFLSGATKAGGEVYCIDALDGKRLWTGEVPLAGGDKFEVMEDTGLAANTLATDGLRVYAIFATGDIAAFDFNGKRLWLKSLGIPESTYGYATSLEVWQDKVLVQYDQAYAEDGKSRMIALEGTSGKVAWETKRPVANSWTSPILAPVGAGYQLIAVGAPWVIGYEPNTGKEIWRAKCVDGDVAPSPVMAGDLVIAVEPYAQSVAIRANGQGDVTETHVAWRNDDSGPDIASPVSDGKRVFMMDTQGELYCLSATDGHLLWEHDYEETIESSPSLVNGKLYVLAEKGIMFIGTPGEEGYTEEAKCELGERCLASPAFARGCLYIRGTEHLYCMGRQEVSPTVSKQPEVNYATPEQLARNWHRFRGFGGAGITDLSDIPTDWDGASGAGIRWQTEIPLPGHNSPVVWEDRVFLSGATEKKREVYCLSTTNGQLLWTGEVPTVPTDEELDIMEDTGLAAGTMATDGVRVYVIYATGDLAAFDMEGKRLWHKHLGTPESTYGYATSLEVWQDRVLVQYDQAYPEDDKSRLFAFAGATGELAWETKRPVGNTWTSPIVAKLGEGYQLVTVGSPWVISYDPNSGQEIWRAECTDGDVAPSPIVAGPVVVAIEPYAHSVGIRWDGQGNVTETHELWRNEDSGPEINTPVSDGQRVFLLDSSLLYCINTQDGRLLWEHDYDEIAQASPSLVGDRLYVLAENGTMFIGTPGEDGLTVDKQNKLGEYCLASPAFMPGTIFIRGEKNLYCVGD